MSSQALPSWINELPKINQMLFVVWAYKIMDCAWADLGIK
jgi:hypothetical protein